MRTLFNASGALNPTNGGGYKNGGDDAYGRRGDLCDWG